MNPHETQEGAGQPRLLLSDQRPPDAPARYTLKYPSTWSHLDLDPHTRDAAIRRRVEEQAKGAGAEPEQVDRLIRQTRKSAREAYAQGALQVGCLIAFLPDASTLNASAMVLRTRIPDDEPTDLAEIMLAAGVQNNRKSVGRGSGLNRVEIMELPEVGPVGRMTSLEDFDYFGQATIRTAVHQVVIPVPSSRDLMVLASTTPNISLAEKFFEVFDAIASTFRFHDSEAPADADTDAAAAVGAESGK
ncbi:hypothetical protein RCO28_13225 [Streptomyces sp. LHD-70]|uniref:hypothetical protein n=1 Tax=Streptomyces sp. LHD-70 TaxID=3072140 RepID=UPI00280DFD2A|nr:hypothetical protein [Streptomyces sp. LHD-70]MDQ8703441.1 hypothetical protein [Streptomyces sp. LHD-70]